MGSARNDQSVTVTNRSSAARAKKKLSTADAITVALIGLMARRPYESITVADIVATAGVGRSSFYRIFGSKQAVLLSYMDKLFQMPVDTAAYDNSNLRGYLAAKFKTIRKNAPFFLVLRENDMLYLLFQGQHKTAAEHIEALDFTKNRYQPAFFSAAATGVIIEWMNSGFAETEEELADIFIELLYGFMDDPRFNQIWVNGDCPH